jgi:hypothetical protein
MDPADRNRVGIIAVPWARVPEAVQDSNGTVRS